MKTTSVCDVAHYFDSVAVEWDSRGLPDDDMIKFLLSVSGVKEGDKVLDVGSGTGVLLPYLSWRVGGNGHVVAVDCSQGMLERSREKNGDLPNVSFRNADVETDLLPGHFDHIIMFNMFPHLRHPFTTIRRLVERNLTVDGNLLIFHSMGRNKLNEMHSHRFGDNEFYRLPEISRLAERIRSEGLKTSSPIDEEDCYGVLVAHSNRNYSIGV